MASQRLLATQLDGISIDDHVFMHRPWSDTEPAGIRREDVAVMRIETIGHRDG